jgi:hypothetical protein
MPCISQTRLEVLRRWRQRLERTMRAVRFRSKVLWARSVRV